MKKIQKSFLGITLAALFLISCGGDKKSSGGENKASSINVSELKTACDHVNATETILDELIKIKGDKKSASELSKEDLEKGKEMSKKLGEIEKSMRQKNFSEKEMAECDGAKRLQEKMMKAK